MYTNVYIFDTFMQNFTLVCCYGAAMLTMCCDEDHTSKTPTFQVTFINYIISCQQDINQADKILDSH